MRHVALMRMTLLLVLWFLPARPLAALAQDAPPSTSGTVCEPVLMPVGGAEAVRLEAATLNATLSCEGAACRLRSDHAYQLRNTMPGQAVSVQVGLSAPSGGCQADADAALRIGDADALRLAGTAEYPALWQVDLPPGGSARLTLTYARELGEVRLLDWWWRSSRLGAWSATDGVHVELSLPVLTTDEAILDVLPYSAGFDGLRFSWSYESPTEVPDHGVTLLAPPLVARLYELRSAGGGAEYARLLLAARTEAAARGRIVPTWDAEIAAALLTTLSAHPDDLTARLDLAELYRQQAGEDEAGRLNYLLLAVQQLEEAHRLAGDDEIVLTALARCYYETALAASESGDPGGAIGYLEQAERLGGARLVPEFDRSEELFLRWALGMARQGQVGEAFARVEQRLSPETMDALLRYAPPVTEVRTRVMLLPGERHVTWDLRPYPPVAEDASARVAALAQIMRGVEGCEVGLTGDSTVLTLSLIERYGSAEEREDLQARLREALSGSGDLLAAVVRAPLEGHVDEYDVSHRPFRDVLAYRESVDLTLVAQAWQGESEYANWRLVELNSMTPEGERARLETQMALAALREQGAIWDTVPLGACVSLEVASLDGTTPAATSWRVLWGETREIAWSRSVWNWGRIGAVAATVLLLGLLLVLAARRGRRPA